MSELPPGFMLEQDSTELPPGFVMDGGEPLRVTVTPRRTGYAEDIARSVPAGLARGASGLVGLPGDVNKGIGYLLDQVEQWARGEGDEEFAARVAKRKAKSSQAPNLLPTSDKVTGAVESVTGPLYQPQTVPGKYAGTVAEFVPGAMLGPGGVGRNIVNFAVAPGIASEAAGQVARGVGAPGAEPYARAGAALLAGGIASAVNKPRTAERALRGALANVDDVTVQRAAQIMDDASAQGVKLTWAEALEQAAPGSGLTNMQRVLESTPGSREVLSPVLAQRPAQVERAARQVFDTVAPVNAQPSRVGPAVGTAADRTIGDVKSIINARIRPFYDAAKSQRIDPATFRTVRADPVFREGLKRVRSDPYIGPTLRGYSDDSVAVIDAIKKQLDETGRNLRDPLSGSARNNYAASIVEQGNKRMVQAADVATGSNPATGTMGVYEGARFMQAEARKRHLEPLLKGPLGKIAARDVTTKKAIDALFPSNPLPNSADEIATAVSALAKRDPQSTRDLVRAYLESTFNETTQNLQTGANQFGGAKFAATIAGNPQQRANLEAAIRASGRDGDQVWNGFQKFLDTVEATGKRQAIGSKTAFNAQELRDLSTGGMIGNAAKTGASPGKWLTAISDAWSRWQLGRNVEQLANILVDPRSRNMLRAIASRPVSSREAQAIAGQLAISANTARHGGPNKR